MGHVKEGIIGGAPEGQVILGKGYRVSGASVRVQKHNSVTTTVKV